MAVVHRISNVIEWGIKGVICAAMLLMSLITIVEVTRRYLLGRSFPWAEELVRYLLIWLSFLGGSIAWKEKGLVFFNLLQDKLAGRGRSGFVLDLLIHFICLAFNLFIAYHAGKYTFSPIIRRQISTGLHISMAYAYVAIPLGFLLIALFTLERIPEILKNCLHAGAVAS